MAEVPTMAEWADAAKVTVPVLAVDDTSMGLLMERFKNKYLRAAMSARNESAEERAWSGFFYWLVAGATNRKPFSATDDEADALIARFRGLTGRLRDAAREVRDG